MNNSITLISQVRKGGSIVFSYFPRISPLPSGRGMASLSLTTTFFCLPTFPEPRTTCSNHRKRPNGTTFQQSDSEPTSLRECLLGTSDGGSQVFGAFYLRCSLEYWLPILGILFPRKRNSTQTTLTTSHHTGVKRDAILLNTTTGINLTNTILG